jgi:hypothetical protein
LQVSANLRPTAKQILELVNANKKLKKSTSDLNPVVGNQQFQNELLQTIKLP